MMKFKNGYSLIEMMIVLMIMALVFAFGVSNYRDFQRRRDFDNVQLELVSNLKKLRSYATSGYTVPSLATCGEVEGFRLFTRPGPDIYEMQVDCSSSGYTLIPGGEIDVGDYGIDLRPPAGTIYFNLLGRGVECTPSCPVIFRLEHDTTGEERRVEVTQSGEVIAL